MGSFVLEYIAEKCTDTCTQMFFMYSYSSTLTSKQNTDIHSVRICERFRYMKNMGAGRPVIGQKYFEEICVSFKDSIEKRLLTYTN